MIVLRDFMPSDLHALVALADNPNVSRYLRDTFPFPYTQAHGAWWINEGAVLDGAVTRAIECHGVLVGGIGITPQHGWRSHLGEIGYWVGEPYWGKGIGTMALNQMSTYAFSNGLFAKLYAPVLKPNIGSMRLLLKCGYVLEGILRAEVRKHGQLFDVHQFALLRP